MAFNNGFPINYQQAYPTYFPGQNYAPQNYGQATQGQSMTPPTIHAEIIQVDDESVVDRFPMSAGNSQMFITKDESSIIIKTMFQNGQFNKDYFDKRPPAPQKPEFDPTAYVRKDEINDFISMALSQKKPIQKKEREEEVK